MNKNDIKTLADQQKVRPDICIHCRGCVEKTNNLLVIELKKHLTDNDLQKAREYTAPPEGCRKFQYQFGLAIVLYGEGLNWKPRLEWFEDGNTGVAQ